MIDGMAGSMRKSGNLDALIWLLYILDGFVTV